MSALLIMTSIQGCVTRHYGREPVLTSYEQENMSCTEIASDMERVREFANRVNYGDEFNDQERISIDDIGLGNHLERSAAIESANKRFHQLRDLQLSKGCDKQAAQAGELKR